MGKVLKKIVCIIGLTLLTAVFVMNIVYTANLEYNEKVTFHINIILYLVESILIAITLYNTCKILKIKLEKRPIGIQKNIIYNIKKKHLILAGIVILYIVLQIVWVNLREVNPGHDQKITYELAEALTNGNVEELLKKRNGI